MAYLSSIRLAIEPYSLWVLIATTFGLGVTMVLNWLPIVEWNVDVRRKLAYFFSFSFSSFDAKNVSLRWLMTAPFSDISKLVLNVFSLDWNFEMDEKEDDDWPPPQLCSPDEDE